MAVIYIGVAFIEGLFCIQTSLGIWIPGRYTEVAFIQGWPLKGFHCSCMNVYAKKLDIIITCTYQMNHHFIVTMELTSCLGWVDSYAICKEERECESNSEYYNVQ